MSADQLHPLLVSGMLLISGYMVSWLATYVGLPRVSGYLAAGILLSPSVSGLISTPALENLSIISDMALAVIAFSIGGSLQYSRIKRLGKAILTITLLQGMLATTIVILALFSLNLFSPIPGASSGTLLIGVLMVLGAISAATAPAATLAVVHEERASGPITTTLLGVVALDDALTIILFSIASATFLALAGGGADFAPVYGAAKDVGEGVLMGLACGFVLAKLLERQSTAQINLVIMMGAILFVAGLSELVECSPLLSNMTMGFTVINRMKHGDEVFSQLDLVEESIFCLFFSLAGAHFDLVSLKSASFLGLALFLGRAAGKISGAGLGGAVSGAESGVRRYLGITLLPQAGVSIGLIFQARALFGEELYTLMLNGVLASIIINAVISPPLIKFALRRSGESKRTSHES
ncbi:MAG: sodium:proton antiporter [Deltaproteobacteria bacterium]|nr:MAG: sodium:proton antiporter [Deltaproteobacteria bacterium]